MKNNAGNVFSTKNMKEYIISEIYTGFLPTGQGEHCEDPTWSVCVPATLIIIEGRVHYQESVGISDFPENSC